MLRVDGWYLIRNRKRMRQYKHTDGQGLITIAGSTCDVLSRGALNSIFKQAGFKSEISGSG